MKYFNKTTLVVGFLLLFANWGSAQNLVTIGTGTSTARQPHGVWYGYERSAAIYQASEIGRSGVIEKLNWYFTGSQTGNYGVRIYLVHTTNNNFAAVTTYANEAANARLVYADSGQVPSNGQWIEFTLDDTFSYYNTENLKVIVETNTGGGGAGNATTIRYTTTTAFTNTHQYWNTDNSAPTGTGVRTSNRPNLQIGFVPDPVPDLLITGFLSPGLAGCNVSSYDLEFQVGNGGGAALNSGAYIRYGYTLNNGSAVIDSFQLTSNLAINGTVNHTISAINSSGIPNLNFKVWANIDADAIKSNDSATYMVSNPNCITSNYTSDFESDNGGWTMDALWAYGAVNKGVLSNPPSGTNGWITDAANNYPNNANASLYSPFIDLNNVCTPVFTWQMRFLTETNWDAVILEASTDNINWVKVTTITPAYQNTSGSGPIAPPKFSGNNNAWTFYSADLSGFKGNITQLRFRFGSDGSGVNPGVAIDDVELILFQNYTGAGLMAPDTVYQDALYDTEIQSTSVNTTGATFDWKLDGIIIGTNKDLDYSFQDVGLHTLTHRVLDACGLVLDSVSKSIFVIAPTAKPSADFVADANNISQFGTVNYTNLTLNGASSYEWYVSPDVYVDPQTQLPLPAISYDNGTTAFSKTPQMSFFGTGTFDVCLIAENAFGRDTLCKSQYINVGGGTAGGTDSLMCVGTSLDAALRPIGNIYDSGGPTGNYLVNQTCSFTINFSCYDSLLLNLTAFNLENNFDYLRIYDGTDATGTALWDNIANPLGMTGAAIPTLQHATSGTLYMEFISDISVVNPGFALHYEARGQKTLIDASFIVADTLCEGFPVTFVSNSVNANSYSWDFSGTGIFITNVAEPTHTYTVPGTYNVVMVAKGCAGVDTSRKTVTVIAVGQNAVNFSSDYTTYTTNDEVVITDITSGCITGYQWVIEPTGATFLNGSDQEAEAHVTFASAGQYTVKLFTSNGVSNDSMVKVNYLTINEICNPKVLTTLSDMGISRVVVGDIDNSSSGSDGYTDYSGLTTTMMKGDSYEIKVFRSTSSNEINRKIWIDYNGDGDFDDAGELIASENAARTPSFTETITVPRNATDGMVTLRVATSYRFQDNEPCGTRSYGETEDYRIKLVSDMEAPVITLIGADTLYINRNDSYNELGATAIDNLDGNLTPNIIITQSLDTALAGTYVIEYDVTDTAGNAAATVVRVLIIYPDAPSIVLNGLASDTMDVFTSYNDLNVLGIDFNGDTLVAMVQSNLDTAVIGTYTITYTVTDQNGRTASSSRNVTVIDQVAPVGILLGMDTVTIEVFGSYMEAGVDISDNYCTSGNTMTASSVDLNTLGTKIITYTLTDCNGNMSMLTRVIMVVDTEAPVIRLKASPAANIVRLRNYTDSGYVLSDNYDPNTNITVETITTLVDTETPGIYTLQYKATDASGNIGYSEIRFIYVSDNVGMDDQAQIKLNVYPNPNKGQFAIETDAFSGEVQVKVIDMYGKSVKIENIDFNGTANLDIAGVAKGTYMVVMTKGDQTAVARIIVQ